MSPRVRGGPRTAAGAGRWAGARRVAGAGAGAVALALLAACTVGPSYRRPSALVPAAYQPAPGWKAAEPRDGAPRGAWWHVFGDRQLDELEARVAVSNQTIAQAEGQLRQARALVRVARAAYFPTVGVSASATALRRSPNALGGTTAAGGVGADYSLSGDVTWELDLWGRVRRTVEANRWGAEASAADLEGARLSAHAELAQAYFQLRTLDTQQQLLEATIRAYAQSLALTRDRYASGVASRADVLQAEVQLEATQAQAIDVGVQRAQLTHAIAVLIGTPASSFALPRAGPPAAPPPIPVGLPAELLERRPDIAGAERRVAAANAQIGVAIAAFYPTLTLSATGGFESSSLTSWLTWPSRFWSVGPSLAGTLFQGGLHRAQLEQARGAYDAVVGAYRQTVLTGFQEVEDNLAALRILADEAEVQQRAVRAAREALRITLDQYRAGTVSYLNVIVSQATALSAEQAAVGILGRRLTAAVLLIKALGGGWSASALQPKP